MHPHMITRIKIWHSIKASKQKKLSAVIFTCQRHPVDTVTDDIKVLKQVKTALYERSSSSVGNIPLTLSLMTSRLKAIKDFVVKEIIFICRQHSADTVTDDIKAS